MPERVSHPGVTAFDSTDYWLERYFPLDRIREVIAEKGEGKSPARLATDLSLIPPDYTEWNDQQDHPDYIRLRRLSEAVWIIAPDFYSEQEKIIAYEHAEFNRRVGMEPLPQPDPIPLTPETIVDLYWFWSRMELPQLKPADLRKLEEVPPSI
jgi:hypothetical protein